MVRRYYNKPPHQGNVRIEINGKEIYRFNRDTEKETDRMSVFSQYRDELKANGQEMDKIPSLKEVDRLLLIRSNTPFFVTSAELVTGQYGTQIAYGIQVDITSKEFSDVNSTTQLVGGEYTLWVKATVGRRDQMKLIEPFIDNHSRLSLVGANGKDWDFDVYDPANTPKGKSQN